MSDKVLPTLPEEEVEGSAPINALMGDDFMDNLRERRAHAMTQVGIRDFKDYIIKRDEEGVDEVFQNGLRAIDFEIQRYVALGLITLQDAYDQLDANFNEIESMRYSMREPEMINAINNTLNILRPTATLEDYYPLDIPGQALRSYHQQASDRIKDTNLGFAERPPRARLVARPRELHKFMTGKKYTPYLLKKGESGPLPTKKQTDARYNEMGPEKKIWDFLGYGDARGGMMASSPPPPSRNKKVKDCRFPGYNPIGIAKHIMEPSRFAAMEQEAAAAVGVPVATFADMAPSVRRNIVLGVLDEVRRRRTEGLLSGSGLTHLVGSGPYQDKAEASVRAFIRINKQRMEDHYKRITGTDVELFRNPQLGALYQQFLRTSVENARAAVKAERRTGAKFNPLRRLGRPDRPQGWLGRLFYGREVADTKEEIIDRQVDEIGEGLVRMVGNFVREQTEAGLREAGIDRESLFDVVEFYTNVAPVEIDNPEAETYRTPRYAPFTTEGSRETVASPVVSAMNPMYRRRVRVVPARRAVAPEPEEEEEEAEEAEAGEVGEADYEGDDEGRFAGEGRVRELLHGAGLGHLVRTPRRKHLGKGI
jgi:hypothetical protein